MATKVYLRKDQDRKWYLLDADGIILGRLATVAAELLRGKGRPTFTPNLDSGDNVIVVNASKVKLSKDSKIEGKKYFHHSGYPGGIKQETFKEAMEKHPERVITLAVTGMLPKTKQGKAQLTRLKVYAGTTHPHTQEVEKVELNTKKSGDKN